MAKIIVFFGLIGTLLIGHSIFGQRTKIFICFGSQEGHEELSTLMKKQKIGYIPIIYGTDIDPNDSGYINKVKFIKKIHSFFPKKSDTGICVIDWESVIATEIEKKAMVGISATEEIKRYIRVVELAKKERPKVKWGFYDMHIRAYYNRTNFWKRANDVYLPLYKAVDIVFPSLYDFYPDSLFGKKRQYEYIDDNIQVVLRLAKKAKKPVYAFLWHRFHDGTPEYGLTAMEKEQFQEHAKRILSNNVEGYKVQALVWWLEDSYWFNINKERVVNEAKKYSSFVSYQNAIWEKYIDALRAASN